VQAKALIPKALIPRALIPRALIPLALIPLALIPRAHDGGRGVQDKHDWQHCNVNHSLSASAFSNKGQRA